MPKPLRDLLRDSVAAWAWSSDRTAASALAIVVVASAAAQAGLMVAGGAIVSALTAERPALPPVLVFALVAALIAVLGWLRTVLAARLGRTYVQQILLTVADAAMTPPTIGHVEDARLRGRLGAASEALREGVHQRVVPAIVDLWTARLAGVASALVLASFHWWAPLVMAAGYLGLIWGYRRWLAGIYDDLAEATGEDRLRAEYYRWLMAEPTAAKEVRLFGLAPWLDQRFGQTWLTAMRLVWARRAQGVLPVLIGGSTLLLALAIVTGTLGFQVVAGSVTAGMVTVAVQAIAGMDSLSYHGDSAWHLSRGRRELATIRQLNSEVATAPAVADTSDPGNAATAVPISIKELSFRYPQATGAILDGLSVEIPAGQSVAVVGANGAGKSTLMKLLCGLYRPTAGTLLVGGRPADSRATRLAAIFQGFGRYHLSLAENVALGSIGDARTDAIRTALTRAGAADVLERVELDTVLSASYRGGTDLSGGQWQKVALARALLAAQSGAGLLILDEPTAALDIRAETELFARFLELTTGLTSVLVSHRLSSVRHAERILVLADGRIVEDGSHDELIRLNGQYAAMFRIQAERFRAERFRAERFGAERFGAERFRDSDPGEGGGGVTADARARDA